MVEFFDGTNYPIFLTSFEDVLEIAGVWKIITGQELRPSKQIGENNILNSHEINDWMARNERAVIIIGSLVGSAHRSDTFREAVSTRNAVDLWKEVKLLYSYSDRMVMSSIRLKFFTLNFDTDKIKIADYYAEIISIKKMLQDTGRPITDEEILDRICLSINGFPLEKLNWHNAHYMIRTQKLSLPPALILLKEAETLTPSAA
ncbi:hypothetical protein K3495_g8824 [Podosphaera aphanis]|nr:hypothetical protein K3495_g8824 [Podosphaera aphanis]